MDMKQERIPVDRTHPADSILQEPMKDMLSAQDRMPGHPSKKVFEHSDTPRNDRRILLRFALSLYRVICQRLL
jgi:hypothetical protein